MNCRELPRALGDYMDGAQEPGGAEVERHLKACRKCRIVCETTRQTVRLYRSAWKVCTLPADIEARLMDAIQRRMSGPV